MLSLGIIRALGVVAGAVALFMLALGWAARQRRRRAARGRGRVEPGSEPEAAHRLELRLAALERGQADFALRLEGAGGAEERLQATAGQLLGLVRDKNATIETALAGLDQLRNRMRVLEQIGDAAEARALFERLGERIAAVEAAPRGADGGQAALVEELRRLHAQKDAATEAVIGRLGPVEARLARLEGEGTAEALARLEARLEAARDAQGATEAALAALRAETAAATAPAAEIADRLGRLHAQKEALAERLLARIAALEAEGAARDPAAALDALGLRLEALRERVGMLETPGESPFAAVSEQLTRLYAQKDAGVEAMLARLAPVEAQVAALAQASAAGDPAVERLAAGIEEVRAAQAAAAAGLGERLEGLRDRVGTLESPGESPFAAVSEQLTRLYAQKDAAVAAMLERLSPVEARLEELGRAVLATDPAVERLAAEIDALRLAQAGLGGRVGALEAPGESPFAAVSEQLTRLYAQKDAAVAAVLERLSPVEARLEELGRAVLAADPAVERLAAELDGAASGAGGARRAGRGAGGARARARSRRCPSS